MQISTIQADWEKTVYVGKTANLRNRIFTAHLMGNRNGRTLKYKMINDDGFVNGKNGFESANSNAERCLDNFFQNAIFNKMQELQFS